MPPPIAMAILHQGWPGAKTAANDATEATHKSADSSDREWERAVKQQYHRINPVATSAGYVATGATSVTPTTAQLDDGAGFPDGNAVPSRKQYRRPTLPACEYQELAEAIQMGNGKSGERLNSDGCR